MFSIEDILKKRIEAASNGTLPEQLINDRKEYNKKWADAVEFFRQRINKDRKKQKMPEYSFIIIRSKLAGVKNIEDLRWFYTQCLKYSYTKDKITKQRNTFSKCFFGALKNK